MEKVKTSGNRRVIKPGVKTFLTSAICIAIGILVGFIIMLISGIASGADPLRGLLIIFTGPFNALNVPKEIGNLLFYTAPLIFTGLSVGIAYKTGLFNIGAPGQFFMGGMGAMLIGLGLQLNFHIIATDALGHLIIWLIALLFGTLLGMIWGAIPGLLKAFFGINEVIASIMTNWIAANIVSWVFENTPNLVNPKNINALYKISETGNGTPTLGLDVLTKGSMLDISIILAIIAAVIIFIIMNKTTFGYELKACGMNRNGAKYAGINEKKYIVLSMVIAGGLSAIGGALYYLNPGIELQYKSAYLNLPAYGFNGIAAALLATCNPFGIIFSALLIRYLNTSGNFFPLAGFNRYFADIIIAVIIYLAGFAAFFKDILNRRELRRVNTKDDSQFKDNSDVNNSNIKTKQNEKTKDEKNNSKKQGKRITKKSRKVGK